MEFFGTQNRIKLDLHDHTHTVSCGAPETDGNVHYSSYNSTLEGSNVTFWCTDRLLSTEAFTSVCHRNTSWIPDPVSQCSTLTSGKNSMKCFCMQNRKAGRSRGLNNTCILTEDLSEYSYIVAK